MAKIAPAIRRHRTTSALPTDGLSVSQVARESGETVHVIRYYCRIGLLQGQRGANGYRRFNQQSLVRTRFIRLAQGLGFTLGEIRTIFTHARAGRSPCPDVRAIVERRVTEVADQLEQLNTLHQRMNQALARWRRLPDRVPTGAEVCALIESESTRSPSPRPRSKP